MAARVAGKNRRLNRVYIVVVVYVGTLARENN